MTDFNHKNREGDYRSIFDNAIEGIFQSSLEGRYLQVNPAMAQIYGYESPDEMVKLVTDISRQIYVDIQTRKQFLDDLLKNGRVDGFEARNYRKDGSIIWTRTNARVVRDENENTLYFEGFLTDITSRKEAEFTLRSGEEKYRALVERLPGAVFLDAPYDSEKALFVSPKIEDLLGYTPEEWMTEISWLDSIHPDDRDRILAENKRTDETGEPFRQEYRFRRKDGAYIWIKEETSLVKDELGKPLFWQGFLLDITNQKIAEKAIKQSDDQFKKIFQANPIASCIATLNEGRYVAANDAYWKLSGFQPSEFLGRTSRELGFLDDQKRSQFVAKLKNEKSIHKEDGKLITKRGGIRNTLEFFDLIVFDGQDCILGMFYDITDQVNVQQALLDNEEKYRQLFEAESDAIFLIDNETGNILEANNAATALYGFSREELLRKKNSDLSAEPDDTRRVTQKTPIDCEQIISIPLRYHKKKDGTIFPVEITGRFFEWRGRPVHIAAIRDITNRKHAEKALKASEERFRLSFQTSPDSINVSRLEDGLYVDINEGFTNITGYTREDTIGKTSLEINIWEDPEDRGKFVDEIKRNGFVNNLEAKFRTKDGSVVTGLVSASVITLNDVPHIISITREIESIKQTEETLQRQLNELSILHDVALAASSSKNVDELIQRVTDTINDTLNPDNCGVGLILDDGDILTPHASYRGTTGDKSRQRMLTTQGVTGKVAATGVPICLGDVSQEPIYVETMAGVKSELCVPIRIQDRVLGVINIESKQLEAFNETDERLLNTIAGTMATAIDQLRLFETSQRRLQELTILNAVGRASTEATNVDELIDKVTQIIGGSLYPDNFGMLLLDEKRSVLIPHPSYRGITEGKFPTTIRLGHGVSGQVASSGKSMRIANVRNHKPYIEVTPQVRSEICVPIAHGDRILGVLNAESLKINAFSEGDEQLLTTIASTLATAIEKLRLFKVEQQRREDAELLREATTTLTTSLELNTLLHVILESLEKIIPYDSASITLERDGEMEIVTGRGFPEKNNFIGKRLPTDGKWVHLAANRQPLIVSDVHKDKTFIQWEGSEYIRGWMSVPLVAHDKIIGAINLDSRNVDTFTQRDASIAQTFVNSAAVAIENARLFEAEQQSRERAEALREATAALASSIELESLYEIILNSAKNLVPFDSASIEILDRGYLEIVAGQGLKNNQVCIGERYPFDSKKWEEFEAFRKPIILPNAQNDNRFVKLEGTEYIRGWMGVPMVAHDQLIGFLNFDSSNENFFTSDHASLAQTFGNQAAIAIENARLFQEESRRSQIIEAMANIANEFATAQELTPVLEKITRRSLELLRASTVAIYLVQDDNKTIKVVTALGAYSEQLSAHTLQIGTGITGNIIANGKPEIVDDMFKDSRRVTVPGTPEEDAHNDTIMSAPLVWRGKTIGAINAWRPRSSGLFNQSELNFLVSIANQTSMLIESIRLLQETTRRAQEAHAIAEVGRDISSTLQIDIVLERIAQYAKELLKAETSAVYLSYPEDLLLRAIVAVGVDAIEIKNDPLPLGKGILGTIALQKTGEIVNNTLEDNRAIIVTGTDANPSEHLMGVPVLSKDQLTGLLAVWRTGEREVFKPFELDFLCSLAQQAAVAIENARLFEGEQRHFQEAETLRQAAEAITSSLDINQVLNAILNNLRQVIPFDSAALFLREGDNVRLTAGVGLPENDKVVNSLFPANNALLQKVWNTGTTLILEDAQSDSRFEKWAAAERVRGWMGVPLSARGVMIGCITIDSYKQGAYNEHDATLATTFAHQAAAAIENAHLYERSEKQIRQLTILRDIDSAISSSFDLRVTLDFLVRQAIEELNADAADILLYKPELQALSTFTQFGFKNKVNAPSSYVRIGEGLGGQVALNRKLVKIPDLDYELEYKNSVLVKEEGFKSYVGVPLLGKGQIKGVIEIYSRVEIDQTDEWLNFLQALAGQAAIAIDNVEMFKNLHHSNLELSLAYDSTLAGWGRALELRDKETQGHTNRVVKLTVELARRLNIKGEALTHITRGALLHDIGKMGIPDNILNKPGLLSEDEWTIMRQHPQFAYDLIYPISYLRPAIEIPYGHHERWDGSGYPLGLKGEEIPLAARIFAVVDIWDALLNERVYREAWPEEKVLEYMKNAAGIELDPEIVEIFLEMIKEVNYKNQAE